MKLKNDLDELDSIKIEVEKLKNERDELCKKETN